MPIQAGDIRLLESDRMDDTEEGGGAITNRVIVNGASNNIFEDISTLDRVYGAVHLRKLFAGINIQTQDKYFGSHLIISKLPGDGKIGVNLFNTKDWFDRRPEAKTRIENYRAKGATYSGFLYATQWAGSLQLSLFQGEYAPIPGVGDVLYLSQYDEAEFQYVKITKLEKWVQTFTDGAGQFNRQMLKLTISQPLEYDFIGAEISRYDTVTPTAGIKTTVVANAAKYYSTRPMRDAGVVGDTDIFVDSVYSQVVPSSMQEESITDENIGADAAQLINTSQATLSFVFAGGFAANTIVYFPGPILPGSLSVPLGGDQLVDSGGLVKVGSETIGTIDYVGRSITFYSDAPSYSGDKTITYRPASAPLKIQDTLSLVVSDANRGKVWNATVFPSPEPGSIKCSYRALGNWYHLYDDAAGGIHGEETGIGTGSVDYATGTVSLTFDALPDADNDIIIAWGTRVNFSNRSNIALDPVEYTFQLTNMGVAPGVLTITWENSGTKTATADAQGNITGDGVGDVDFATGLIKFTPNILPMGGTSFTIDYDTGEPLEQSFANMTTTGGNLVIDLGVADIEPNSVSLNWGVNIDPEETEVIKLVGSRPSTTYDRDNGVGGFKHHAGSISYVAGTISINGSDTVSNFPEPTYETQPVGQRRSSGGSSSGGSSSGSTGSNSGSTHYTSKLKGFKGPDAS